MNRKLFGISTVSSHFRTNVNASIWSGRQAGFTTGSDDLDREMEAMSSRVLYIIPADRNTEMIDVQAVQGLMPKEYRRVVAELHAAIALDG